MKNEKMVRGQTYDQLPVDERAARIQYDKLERNAERQFNRVRRQAAAAFKASTVVARERRAYVLAKAHGEFSAEMELARKETGCGMGGWKKPQ